MHWDYSQNCQGYTSSEALEDSEEGIELNIGFPVFQTGDICFLCADTLSELLLGQSGLETFFL